MMKEYFYRFLVDGIGVYEKVETDCPKHDTRRKNKPDGSWLPKVGQKFPGAISFWTQKGLKKYEKSGLRVWHQSVTTGNNELLTITKPSQIIYQDDWQIICSINAINIINTYQVPRPFVTKDFYFELKENNKINPYL